MMKRVLLMACMFPCLAFAQFQQKSYLLSSTPTLDSTYLYQGEEGRLTDIQVFTYDEEGRKSRSVRKAADGVVSGKIEYVYTAEANGECVEEQGYSFLQGGGSPELISKTWNHFNKSGLQYALEEYAYVNNEWKKTWVYSAVEFEGDRPTVVLDSTFNRDGSVDVMRMVAKYDKAGYPDSSYVYGWDAENKRWTPQMRSKLTYNAKGNQICQYSEVFEEGEWVFSFEYTYEYDERGNMTHEVDRESFTDQLFPLRYQNFYSDKLVTHTDPVSLPDMKISFNAASRTVCVDLGKSASGTLRLISASGTLIGEYTLNQSVNEIQLDSFRKGYHVIVITTPKGIKSQGVIL